jgi:hypothetical protein
MAIKIKLMFINVALMAIVTSCETRTIKYSALNDLVIGGQQIVLYKNGEFYLELGAGGAEGSYIMLSDTVNLHYNNKPENWPDQLLMTKDYFLTIPETQHNKIIKFRRH